MKLPALLLIAALVAGCGDGTGGDTTLPDDTTTTLPVTTTQPTTTASVVAGDPVALSDLTGQWETETHLLVVEEGGSYELLEATPGAEPVTTGVFGFIALQDGMLIFPTSANPGPCSGETGVYSGEMRDGVLHLTTVDEPCEFREEIFQSPWSRVG